MLLMGGDNATATICRGLLISGVVAGFGAGDIDGWDSAICNLDELGKLLLGFASADMRLLAMLPMMVDCCFSFSSRSISSFFCLATNPRRDGAILQHCYEMHIGLIRADTLFI
jgi:hypothetical protein